MPKTNHPRISQTEWESHKDTIEKLYLSEGNGLKGEGGVIDLMRRKGFSASKTQYESQFIIWGFKKKLTRETWHIIGRIVKDRDEAGLTSHVHAHGIDITDEKVKRETARYRKCEANGECCLKKDLPRGVEVRSDQVGHEQEEAEETTPSLESEDIHSNNSQTTSPSRALHAFEESWNLASYYDCYQMNNSNDLYNRVSRDHPTPNFSGDSSPYFSHSDALPLFASTRQSPSILFPGIHGVQNIFYIPRSTISLFKDLNKPLFREFRALLRNNQSRILDSINETKYLLPRDPGRELQKDSVDMVILKQTLYLLMNNFAGSDYAVFDTIFEQVRQFSTAHMEDMLKALPKPYAAALQQSILTIAIKSNIPALVSVLLRRGLDINRVTCRFGGDQFTPLGLACKFRHLEVVKILLHADADPNAMIGQDPYSSPICLLMDMKDYSTRNEEFLPPTVVDTLRCLLDANARMHWRVLESPTFWGNEALIDAYIKHNKLPIDTSLPKRYTIFLHAPKNMDRCKADKIAAVLQSAYHGLNLQEDSGSFERNFRFALSIASYQGSLDVIDYCLELGFSPDLKCLCQAIYGNNLALVKRYVKLGVEMNKIDPYHYLEEKPVGVSLSNVDSYLLEGYSFNDCPTTAFAEAIRHGCQDIVSWLKNCCLLQGTTKSNDFGRAILAAAEVGNGNMVQELLAIHSSHAERDLEPERLSVAAATFTGNDDIVELLMMAGVRPNNTSIAAAILTRNSRLIELFLNSAMSVQSETAIAYLAVRWGDYNILKSLIDAGVSFSGVETSLSPLRLRSLDSSTFVPPLREAIFQGDHKVVQMLLEHDADVNSYFPLTYTSPLAQAVQCGDQPLIQTLLDHGADPNDPHALQAAAKKSCKLTRAILVSFRQRYPNGNKNFAVPALRDAIKKKDETLISMLARHADINVATYSQTTELNYWHHEHLPSLLGEGIATGSIKIVQTLLDSGGDPNSTVEFSDEGRLNAVLKAISTGNLGMVKLLHSAKANLNFSATLRITRTALQLAVELGHFEIVEYLLNQGVDVNAPPCIWEGATALQLAAKTGSIRIAELLLDHGAKINAPGSKYLGKTAFEFAAEHGRMDMLLLLFHRDVDFVSDGSEQIRRAQELAEENGQIAAKDLVEQLDAEAQRRAFFDSEANSRPDLMTDTFAEVGLLGIY